MDHEANLTISALKLGIFYKPPLDEEGRKEFQEC
jgi:hypothetical protein